MMVWKDKCIPSKGKVMNYCKRCDLSFPLDLNVCPFCFVRKLSKGGLVVDGFPVEEGVLRDYSDWKEDKRVG